MAAFTGRRCAGLLILFLGLVAASLPGRFLHLDDAWLGEQSYWLAREGVPRSELLRGTLGYEERIWVFHKLFVVLGAGAVALLGWSAVVLKSVGLAFLAATLLLLWRHLRGPLSLAPRQAALGLVPLLAHPLVVEYGYTFRPEIALAAVGLASWGLLERHLRGSGWPPLVGAALLAGVAVLLHLHGVMFIAAGTVVLVLDRRGRAALAYLALSCAVGGLYLADVALCGAWEPFRRQLAGDPALADLGPWNPLARLAREPKRWLHRGEGVGLALLTLATLATALPALGRRHRPLLVYTATLAAVLALIASSITVKYLVPILPFVCLWNALALAQARERGAVRAAALVLFLGAALVSDVQLVLRCDHPVRRNARIAERIEGKDPVVLAPLTFVYDQLVHLRIQGLLPYRWLERRRGEPLSLPELLRLARTSGVTHVVLIPGARDCPTLGDLDSALTGELPHYRVAARIDGALLLAVR